MTGRSTTDAVSLGAMGDSYYEYLLKVCCVPALSDWKGCRAAARTLLAILLYKLQIVFKKDFISQHGAAVYVIRLSSNAWGVVRC